MLRESTSDFVITRPRSYVQSFGKRSIDLTGALVGSVFFLILYPVVGVFIKLESRGPVLVRLRRVSGGRIIDLYKFRSMYQDAHLFKDSLLPLNERSDGPFFKLRCDPRITRSGRVIRKFRLDEMPQFINVLLGEMSLVGPRPHEPEEVENYPANFRFLAKEKGGITGLSQVSGASGLPFKRELELDGYYAENRSVWLDVKIIAKTAWIMLFDPTAV
ncbi:MAG: hypothetical protein COU10_03050 [Candidatus Harrisonbacteria bacterium CG10_big_fil_rev_8_21_14_0_10_45_28]|uniref:Bacterial sugar transferase domain-containing protein n=1 Tax=Candidatus Harrisonbacteria bacterium CG10_big_fil_rev_8_21_14_0_10_45_28 TaxID=1974586 RepID=A0A2H0UPJ7_9BACT|nr:MAG: hypothetical protein COU10_03050 [Candidatus Harrisonbacteria bacterium CG10_big_fil_rev_8_21_14_0_10_45_28]